MNDEKWFMKPNKTKAVMLAKRHLVELVWDGMNLDGITFTLPEIRNLLKGISVIGRKLSDQQIVINQVETWLKMFMLIETNHFEVSLKNACDLHRIAANGEVTECGSLRTAGAEVAGAGFKSPDASKLPALFEKMIEKVKRIKDIYNQAIHLFLTMAGCRFFNGANKRLGRFIMNGFLLDHGFPVINIPSKLKHEFNERMDVFYMSGDQQPMNDFLRSCLDERIIKIMKK